MDAPESERLLAAWYLVQRKADVQASSLRAEHFKSVRIRNLWLAATNTRDWLPRDLGLTPEEMAALGFIRLRESDVPACERKILRAWQLRHTESRIAEIQTAIKSGEIADPESAQAVIRGLLADVEAGGPVESKTHKQVTIEAFEEWSKSITDQRKQMIPMPLRSMAERLVGWERGNLYQIGAVTSGHKTTLARVAAWHAAKCGFRVLFWTMEDSDRQIAKRTWAAEVYGCTTRTWRVGQKPDGLEQSAMETVMQSLGDHAASPPSGKLRYFDEGVPTLSRVLSVVSAETAKGLDLLIIDFLQLIQPDTSRMSEVEHLFRVSNNLAAIAKRHSIVVLATVQPTQMATRELDRLQKPITKGDLRGGASIAQAAFGVLLLNPFYDKESGERQLDRLKITVAKWKDCSPETFCVGIEAHHDRMFDV